jgi:hypothetical protein
VCACVCLCLCPCVDSVCQRVRVQRVCARLFVCVWPVRLFFSLCVCVCVCLCVFHAHASALWLLLGWAACLLGVLDGWGVNECPRLHEKSRDALRRLPGMCALHDVCVCVPPVRLLNRRMHRQQRRRRCVGISLDQMCMLLALLFVRVRVSRCIDL